MQFESVVIVKFALYFVSALQLFDDNVLSGVEHLYGQYYGGQQHEKS